MHKPFLALLCLLHATLDQILDKHLPRKLQEEEIKVNKNFQQTLLSSHLKSLPLPQVYTKSLHQIDDILLTSKIPSHHHTWIE